MTEIVQKDPTSRRALMGLTALVLLFLILRLPVIFSQIPAQDEDYFAVPGYTILEEGIPRVPYLPARSEDSVFYRSDTMLFTLPPLYFYLQSLFYLLFGATTSVARLVAMACGILGVYVLWALSKRFTSSIVVALVASGLYLFSRVIYFPSVIARPDTLCGLFGLLTILCVDRYAQHRNFRWLFLCGLSGGLGMLTHPFALVYCIQAGVWLLVIDKDWTQKLRNASIFSSIALVAFSLWLLLILQEPELFQRQFGNNVLGKSGPGIFQRFVLPWNSFRVQIPLYLEHLGLAQSVLLTLGSLYVCTKALRVRERRYLLPAILTISGIYLHVVCQGDHPNQRYWIYTCAFQFLCVGVLVADLYRTLLRRSSQKVAGAWTAIAICAMAVAMLPGSGIRTFMAYVVNDDDIAYDAPRFTSQLMNRFEKDQKLIVDPGYIFEFYKAGYDVTLALNWDFFFQVKGTEYDYLVGGPSSIRDEVWKDLNAIEFGRVGNFEDPFACRSILYRNPVREEIPEHD